MKNKKKHEGKKKEAEPLKVEAGSCPSAARGGNKMERKTAGKYGCFERHDA